MISPASITHDDRSYRPCLGLFGESIVSGEIYLLYKNCWPNKRAVLLCRAEHVNDFPLQITGDEFINAHTVPLSTF